MLGEFLLAARKRRYLSQRALAQRAGITPSYLSEIECHGHIPSRDVLQSLARGLALPDILLIAMLYPDAEVSVSEEAVLCPQSC